MKKFILTLVFFICLGKLSAGNNQLNSRNLEFHINPVTLLDFTPRWRAGFEYTSKKQLAFSLDFGIGTYYLNRERLNGLIWDKHYTFREIRPELKYYLGNRGKDYAFYTALEGFYLNMSDILKDNYYYPVSSGEKVYYDQVRITKTKIGGDIKLGLKTMLWNRVTFDFYAGIGAAYRDFSYTNVINPDTPDDIHFEEWWSGRYHYAGSSTNLHITGGFKIGYIIPTH